MFIVAAFILFVLSAIGVGGGRINLQSAGLACWALYLLLGGLILR
jgi:hypothetical protein